MLELLPDSAAVESGELSLGGAQAADLSAEFGTPLIVYCEQTLLECVRAYRSAAPDAMLVYGVKAFPNVAIMRLFAGEGLGADVSTLGELGFALRAGISGERIVVHGNNKSDEELRAAAEADVRFVVLDALPAVERAADAGVRRVLVRVTPGIDADTHAAIRTAHHGSKFGLPPAQAIAAVARSLEVGLDVQGLHVHIGSQLLDAEAAETTVEWLAGFAVECRAELGWTPAIVDLGGGLGIQYVEGEAPPSIADFVSSLTGRLAHECKLHGLPQPDVVLEPGRSLVGRAGVTLYRVGVVKQATETTTYVSVDGGMSDNPRPQLYGARYAAMHCESGDVLIEHVALPEPRRGDLLAVPGTGAYTLGMGSNYNALPRPAAVLVADGRARLIRRRETLDDLFALEET